METFPTKKEDKKKLLKIGRQSDIVHVIQKYV